MAIKTNIPYTDKHNPLQSLDIYIPESGYNFPVLIHIHGGAWSFGDKENTTQHGQFYADNGILTFSINHRLSPQVRHPEHIEDCALAVAWILENLSEYNGNPERVFISGHSSGGHLAALLACDVKYRSSSIAGIISVDSASYDLTAAPDMIIDKIEEIFGTENLQDASPMDKISPDTRYPKFLIATSNKREIAVNQAQEFTDKLKEAGVDTALLIMKNLSHRRMNESMYEGELANEILKFIQES